MTIEETQAKKVKFSPSISEITSDAGENYTEMNPTQYSLDEGEIHYSEENQETMESDNEEIMSEVYDTFNNPTEGPTKINKILEHKWKNGELYLKVKHDTEEMTLERLRDVKIDEPKITASYNIQNYTPRRKTRSDRIMQWAKRYNRKMDKVVRVLFYIYDMELDGN